MKRTGGIFISYRRDGGEGLAGRVRDTLTQRGYSVFLDVEDLSTGKFNEALFREINNRPDFIIILTPGSLDRCANANDWVRLEIAYALRQRKNIIPVIGRNFNFPDQLPQDIDGLRYLNGIPASHDFFSASVEKISKHLISRPQKSSCLKMVLAIFCGTVLCTLTFGYLSGRKSQEQFETTTFPLPQPTPPLEPKLEALLTKAAASTEDTVNNIKAASHAKQIAIAMKQFAAENSGKYPDSVPTPARTSNEAFHRLFQDEITTDEMIFTSTVFSPQSDGYVGKAPDYSEALRPGENHWAMTANQTNSSPGNLPILFTAPHLSTWPPAWAASTSDHQLGEAMPGQKIVIAYNDGSVETLNLVNDPQTGFWTLPDPSKWRAFGPQTVLNVEK